jgi:acetyl esterase/lipase
MIGHYPWTYADQRRRRADRPEYESEDLFTTDQMQAYAREAVALERERLADHFDNLASKCSVIDLRIAYRRTAEVIRGKSPNTTDEPRPSGVSI